LSARCASRGALDDGIRSGCSVRPIPSRCPPKRSPAGPRPSQPRQRVVVFAIPSLIDSPTDSQLGRFPDSRVTWNGGASTVEDQEPRVDAPPRHRADPHPLDVVSPEETPPLRGYDADRADFFPRPCTPIPV